MKKIIALILSLCCVFALFSCDKDGDETSAVDGVAEFVKMYSTSEPTKAVTSHTTKIGNVSLSGKSTLTAGTLSDGKRATVLVEERENLLSVQLGAGASIIPITGEPIKTSREFVEGRGVRENGGGWDSEMGDFAPKAGSIALKLDTQLLKDVSYIDGGSSSTLSFKVEAANTSAVLGEGYTLQSDASVVITSNKAVITSVIITYAEEIPLEDEDSEFIYPEAEVTISTVYTYSIETVTLLK